MTWFEGNSELLLWLKDLLNLTLELKKIPTFIQPWVCLASTSIRKCLSSNQFIKLSYQLPATLQKKNFLMQKTWEDIGVPRRCVTAGGRGMGWENSIRDMKKGLKIIFPIGPNGFSQDWSCLTHASVPATLFSHTTLRSDKVRDGQLLVWTNKVRYYILQ